MLPSGLTREVLGARRRPEAPESQTAQLVGRSRSERLLDKLYNRQSRVLRDTERRRRQRKTVFLASEAKRRRENEVKPPSDIHAVKQTGDTKHQGSGASASSVASSNVSPTLRTDVVISNLVKHTSSPAKFPKVVRLSRQLVERAYSESDRGRFLHLFCALALNTTITSLPSESRGDAVAFGRALTEALCKSSQPLPFSLPNTDFLDDPAAHSDYLNETVPLNDWVAVLQLSVIWNNLLFTDDTYQFHTALSRFSSAFDALPYFSFYESFSSPTTLASLASSLLARHASAAVLSANASPVDCRISSSPAPSESGVSCDSFTLPNDQLCTAGQANGTSEASSPKEALQHFSHEPQSQQSDSDRGGDEENDDSQWLPTRRIYFDVQRQLIMNSLPTIVQFNKTRWARTAVCKFFQSLYVARHSKFSPAEAVCIEAWQSNIRQVAPEASSLGRGLRTTVVGESMRPVRDARDERVVTVHGAAIWSAKQAGL